MAFSWRINNIEINVIPFSNSWDYEDFETGITFAKQPQTLGENKDNIK